MDISVREMAEKLKEYDNYCIVYHIRPDGDCIGSAFGLCLALQSVGKKCTVRGQDEIPRIHRYMTDKVYYLLRFRPFHNAHKLCMVCQGLRQPDA